MNAGAQETEPRAYTPAPVGTTIYFAGVGESDGAVRIDPSFDIEDVHVDLWFATVGVGRIFDVFGQQARILALLPYLDGDVTGDVRGTHQEFEFEGVGDPRIKFTLGLFGSPALSVAEFAREKKDTSFGVSLTVVPPLGYYAADKLVNPGSNRWAFKPEIGLSHSSGPWQFETSVGVWLFTDNDDFFPGHVTRERQPITQLQGYASYTFEDGSWLGANAFWFIGGETTTGGVSDKNRQNNLHIAVTYSLEIGEGQSLKFTYGNAVSTRRGVDFDTIGVTWELVTY